MPNQSSPFTTCCLFSISVICRNSATLGLCSKCYRETHAEEQKKATEASAPEPIVAPPAAPKAEVEVAPAVEAPVEAPTAPVEQAAPAVPSPSQPEKPIQANRNRCFNCNKKVGLLGFECRCGYVYCSGHRHAADHTCTFDYAAFDRERLAKANPLIAASKLDKL